MIDRRHRGWTELTRWADYGNVFEAAADDDVRRSPCASALLHLLLGSFVTSAGPDLAPFPPGHTFEPDERGILREVCPEAEVTS